METPKAVHIITSFLPAADVSYDFIDSLRVACTDMGAHFHIIENQANYLSDYEHPLTLALREEFDEYLVKKDVKINSNLYISSHKMNVNLVDPISGMESQASRTSSFILGYPRQRSKLVPRMLRESTLPRAIWCTGTVSTPLYKYTKTGMRMAPFHIYGALKVELYDNDRFEVRQLRWDGKGFYDRKKYYTKTDVTYVPDAVEAVMLGDDHTPFLNPVIVDKTIELLKELTPKYVIHQDTLDMCSISHHMVNKIISRAVLDMTLEQEGELTVNYLSRMIESTTAKHFLIASNHPEHLIRYLEEARYQNDAKNHILALKLAARQAEHGDAIEYFLKDYCSKYKKLPRFKYIPRKQSMKICGIEHSDHGDYGPNGSKGNSREKGIVYGGQSNSGHTHSPEIGIYGNFVAGTSTFLVLDYTPDCGSSSWANAHIVTYKNGMRTQEFILP